MAAVLQHHALLLGVEGNLLLPAVDLAVLPVGQPLHALAAEDGLLHDLLAVVQLHLGVQPALGLHPHQRAHLAEAVAAALLEAHGFVVGLVGQLHGHGDAPRLQHGLQPVVDVQGTARHAARAAADEDLLRLQRQGLLTDVAQVLQVLPAHQLRHACVAPLRQFRLQFVQQLGRLVRGHRAVHRAVHGHGRGQAAGAQAGHRLHGEVQVVGGLLAVGQAQLLPQPLEDRYGAAHMAGRAVAAADHVLALGLQREVLVERRHAVQPGLPHADGLRHVGEDLPRQVVVVLLDVLEDGDGGKLAPGMAVQDAIHRGKVELSGHCEASPFLWLYPSVKMQDTSGPLVEHALSNCVEQAAHRSVRAAPAPLRRWGQIVL